MKISTLSCNAAVNAVSALIDAGSPPGHLYFRTGSAPTNTTDADSGTLLATLTFSNTSFGAASAGTATAAAITSETNAPASGTAQHFRIKNAANTTIMQGTVGTSASDIVLDSTSIISGGTVAMTSLTLSQPPGS